jgi:hypothetical protein
LVDNNEKIQLIGNGLIVRVEELVKETKKQNNILVAIETLNKLLPVFNIYKRLKIEMKEKKDYYRALKLLEEMEVNYLPVVRQFRFSKSIQETIPLFKEEIRLETITNLKNFLESLRLQSEKVGKVANQQMATKLKIDKKYYLMESELKNDEQKSDDQNSVKITL